MEDTSGLAQEDDCSTIFWPTKRQKVSSKQHLHVLDSVFINIGIIALLFCFFGAFVSGLALSVYNLKCSSSAIPNLLCEGRGEYFA